MTFGIEIRGLFSARFGSALGDVDVEALHETSVLRGAVTSKTQLRRLLARLEDCGIEVLSVTVDGQGAGPTASEGRPGVLAPVRAELSAG
jgi:hypothetical protein